MSAKHCSTCTCFQSETTDESELFSRVGQMLSGWKQGCGPGEWSDFDESVLQQWNAWRTSVAGGMQRRALEASLNRHVKWRQRALGFFHQILEGRGTEDEWPALAEFVDNSETGPRLAEKTNDNCEHGIPRRFCTALHENKP